MSFISKTIAWVLKMATAAVIAIRTQADEAGHALKVDIAPVIVAITGGINTALSSGILGSIAGVLESILPALGHLPEDLIAEAKIWVPKLLATALAIEGIPDNPTQQDILDFEKRVMDAFNIVSDTSKFYTTFAADMFGIIQKFSTDTAPKTFAQKVILIENIFLAYKSDVLDPKAVVAAA